MKFLTVFAFACVATFVVLRGTYGSPLPEPVPEPSPVAYPEPKAEPAANPESGAKLIPLGGPYPYPYRPASAVAGNGSQPAGGDASFVALSANADPMLPGAGAGNLKVADGPADIVAV